MFVDRELSVYSREDGQGAKALVGLTKGAFFRGCRLRGREELVSLWLCLVICMHIRSQPYLKLEYDELCSFFPPHITALCDLSVSVLRNIDIP